MPGHLSGLLDRLRSQRDATRIREQPRPLSPELEFFSRDRGGFPEELLPTEEEKEAARLRLGKQPGSVQTLLPMLLGGARRGIRETLFAPLSRVPLRRDGPLGEVLRPLRETLEGLSTELNLPEFEAHDAMADVRATIRLARALLSRLTYHSEVMSAVKGGNGA